jgi:uncharacterized membrane protein
LAHPEHLGELLSDQLSRRYGNSSSPVDGETTGRTLVALFAHRTDAEDAIRHLKEAGFSNEDIGVATHEQIDSRAANNDTPRTEAAAAGAVNGSVVGGLLGLIGSLLIPGVGPVVLGGVLASTLMGAGIGAAAGGLIGALTGMGVPEKDARHFDAGLRAGGTLVTVRADQRMAEALAVLEDRGADLGPGARVPDRRSAEAGHYSGPERRLIHT